MKKFNIILLNLCLILLLDLSAFSQNLPDIKARVTDQTETLSPSQIQTLEEKLKIFEQEKGSQVIVLIISSTEEYSIEEYSIFLAEKAQIGRKGVDDGVIMLFAMTDRKMRIEVGYGLEGAIPDAYAKRIITNVIVPEFRAGHFYKGIDNGVNIILDLIRGEELPPALANNSSDSLDDRGTIFIFFGIFFTFFLRMFFQKSLGKVGSFLIVSAVIFLIIWGIISLEIAIMYEVLLFFIYIFSRAKGSGGGSFGGGGGFSSGGGGGGFSGGGGSFGGGGSSGSW